MLKYEDGIWHIGRWDFLIHDAGWILARDMVIRLEASWPTWRTFHRKRRITPVTRQGDA